MLKIGIATRSIVPNRPALVQGQKYVRIAHEAADPISATAMAVSGQRADGSAEGVVIVSLDVAMVPTPLIEGVRKRVAAAMPEIKREGIILAATHTHDSHTLVEGAYPAQGPEIMTPPESIEFVADRAAEAVVEAWKARSPCKIARAFGHAVVAHNRRPVYADGSAQMYGNAANKNFRWIEGPEDHTVDMLFVWDAAGRLVGMLLDVPCPSQVEEHLTKWSSDYWHEVRLELKARYGQHLWVLPLCGAAGDVSPHFIFDKAQEKEMMARRGVTERQEVALRIADAVDRAFKCTKPAEGNVVLAHRSDHLRLTARKITRAERDWSEAQYKIALGEMDPQLWWPKRLKEVVDLHDGKIQRSPMAVECHTLRIGDAVLATNPFELYTDYGLQIKARSVAAQTFIAQLAGGSAWYLPTKRGTDGGGYGSLPVVSVVADEGGQELVEHTVAAIASLFPEAAAKK